MIQISISDKINGNNINIKAPYYGGDSHHIYNRVKLNDKAEMFIHRKDYTEDSELFERNPLEEQTMSLVLKINIDKRRAMPLLCGCYHYTNRSSMEHNWEKYVVQ